MSLEWLLDSVEAKKKVEETQYLMTNMPDSKNDSKGKKRARTNSAEEDKPTLTSNDDNKQEPPAKKQKDGQKAKSGSIRIPIDEGCTVDRKSRHHNNTSRFTLDITHWLTATARVYIDDSGIIYDAALNQTNVGNNNNKFYRIQVEPLP